MIYRNIKDEMENILEDKVNKTLEQFHDFAIKLMELENRMKDYDCILRDSFKINQQLHMKNLQVEQQIATLSKRLDMELDNYLPRLVKNELNLYNLDKACELRHAIYINPEPDKLIDKLKGLE